MIKLKSKQEIVLMHIRDGKSQREISRITGRDRKTIRKYIREYEEKRRCLIQNEGVDAEEIISSIVEKPRYDTSNRQKQKLTDEVIKRIKFYLKENERRKGMGLHKQIRKKKWEVLYIERWLKAPMVTVNQVAEEREVGTPQGGICKA